MTVAVVDPLERSHTVRCLMDGCPSAVTIHQRRAVDSDRGGWSRWSPSADAQLHAAGFELGYCAACWAAAGGR